MSNVIHSRMGILAVLFVTALILLPPSAPNAAAEDIVIVANKAFKVGYISKEDLVAVFLGKKTSWGSGDAALFAVFDDSAAQEVFFPKYIKKNAAQFKNYWKKRVFTGKGRMPKYLNSREDVLEFVRASPGAVSFLPGPVGEDVKILTVK